MSDGTLLTLDLTMFDDVNNASGLIQLDSNANIPVCSGAALTNLPGVTKNSSDPAVDTNPSGGVGSVWQNTTSGEMYICTDATAGANVWTNIGAGSGNITGWVFPGETYGYTHGGGSPALTNVIDKVSYTTDGNATDVGDLNTATWAGAAGSSLTHGYIACGYGHPAVTSNRIEKYAFASSANASQIGTMTAARGNETLGGSSSTTHGYAMGGMNPATTNIIDKYSFVTDGNGTDVGDITIAKTNLGGTQE